MWIACLKREARMAGFCENCIDAIAAQGQMGQNPLDKVLLFIKGIYD
jgi:hypothetical protein